MTSNACTRAGVKSAFYVSARRTCLGANSVTRHIKHQMRYTYWFFRYNPLMLPSFSHRSTITCVSFRNILIWNGVSCG